jgi:hypothetical protein
MNQKNQSGQSWSSEQKEQQLTDEQRRREQQRREQSKAAEKHETGSTSNSQPGSGPG